jgi:hypothetical protein
MPRHITIKHMKATANMGSALDDSIEEAMSIAMDERRTVVLVHNNREYIVNPDEWRSQIVIEANRPQAMPAEAAKTQPTRTF